MAVQPHPTPPPLSNRVLCRVIFTAQLLLHVEYRSKMFHSYFASKIEPQN